MNRYALLAVLLAFAGCNAAPANLTTPFLEAYWESWNSEDSIQTIVAMDSNVITVSFATWEILSPNVFNITGLDCSQSELNQIIELAHSSGKLIKQSFGGATYGLGGFLTSVEAAEGMALAVATYIEDNGFDGADFDIEDYPAANLQIALLNAVRAHLPNALISYTPQAPASTTAPYDEVIQGAYQNLTSISIMAYDAYNGYSYETDVQGLMSMGVPASKIVVGLMPGKDDEGIETSLDDVIGAAKYAKSEGLGGIMLWDLNRDHEDLTGLGIDASTEAVWSIFQ